VVFQLSWRLDDSSSISAKLEMRGLFSSISAKLEMRGQVSSISTKFKMR
jgi:hypothetical protein